MWCEISWAMIDENYVMEWELDSQTKAKRQNLIWCKSDFRKLNLRNLSLLNF